MSGSADIIVRARDLRKVYRLYSGQGYKFLDMFGMLGSRPGAYTEHAALDGIDLDVRRGEKVAFIGRNGAGKSTLLKLITNVVQPTSGVIDVKGKVHALLQIGTGFHPDFTGTENVFAYLAQLGVTGREAQLKYANIVEFAELEEYIGQPVKTYSSGMAVRLMFSTATAITPELLVLDEVLGVGDAYFAQKSYERMRELCEGSGTTLLLVTHDIYSAVKMCERLIWVDRGRILMDGAGPLVIKAYEDSIRQQEEVRLRIKKQERLKALARDRQVGRRAHLLFEISAADGRPLDAPVYFSRIALTAGGSEVASVSLGPDSFADERASHLQREGSSWGDAVEWEGRSSRPMRNFGGSFHKVAGVLAVDVDVESSADLQLEFDYWTEATGALAVQCFLDKRVLAAAQVTLSTRAWTRHAAAVRFTATDGAASPLNTTGVHGSGAIVVDGARVVDAEGRETQSLRHGEPVTFQIDFNVIDPTLRERSQVVVALHRDGVQDVCRWISRDLMFDGAACPRGTAELHIPRLLLTDGDYSVTILVAREGYYDREQTQFFTINKDVYYCASRMFDIVVRGAGLIGSGTMSVAEGEWMAPR
jgi:ABC-type polysaccharide/polyol phosphate transport system ATPase subunit